MLKAGRRGSGAPVMSERPSCGGAQLRTYTKYFRCLLCNPSLVSRYVPFFQLDANREIMDTR